MHAWGARARAIPDGPIREDALDALHRKRPHADGAALFSILPRRRNQCLLRLLVAYEVIFDFLDGLHERNASIENGRQLFVALQDALDPDARISTYYRHHLCRDDGDYLHVLVGVCRHSCTLLPGYAHVREAVHREARRALVLGINHRGESADRDAALELWARRECQGYPDASWFELASAASATLTTHALLALAAETGCSERDVAAICAAYFPWMSATCTMLDSYVDQFEDREHGEHSYVRHYLSANVVAQRVGELVYRSAQEAAALRNGPRHAVIAAAMVSMYLSRDSAQLPMMRATTMRLVGAGGSLSVALLPILRLWRTLYALRSA